jgi:serine/threonine-protein kinase RsbW
MHGESDGHRSAGVTLAEVRLAADPAQLYVLRSVTAALALRAEFDLDEVDDLTLAVDEMCSALVARASRGEVLNCQFRAAADSVRVRASVPSDDGRPLPTNTFGWTVLTTLTDRAETWITPGQRSAYEVHAGISRQRADV